MRRLSPIFALAIASVCLVASLQGKAGDPAALDTVLKKMDSVAASFTTCQADFDWQTYQRVIDEIADVKKGVIYYRRSGKQIEMMAQVKQGGTSESSLKPEPEFVLLSGGQVRLYQPKLDRVTEYDLGKNQSDFETYIVLGFGGSGQDLQKTFDVTYAGQQNVDGVATAELHLVPKSEKVRGTYKEIDLWIDLDRGVSVQQKLIQPQGDYRLAKYSQIKLHEKISDDVFKLKTSGKTEVVRPKG